MLRIRLSIGLAGLAVALAAAPSTAADPLLPEFKYGKFSCKYVERGAPGAPGNALTIDTVPRSVGNNEILLYVATLSRRGRHLRLLQGAKKDPVVCSGTARPRIDNLDLIDATLRGGDFNSLTVNEAGGSLGPGVTPESKGRQELEVRARGGRRASIGVQLGKEANSVRAHARESAAWVVNVDGTDEDRDPDIVTDRGMSIELGLGAGSDRAALDLLPDIERVGGVVVDGGAGPDLITGSRKSEGLGGGPGPDVIRGRGGVDFLIDGAGADLLKAGQGGDIVLTGRGNDLIRAGSGSDIALAGGGGHDRLECGRGKDHVEVDRRDGVLGCEDIHYGRTRSIDTGDSVIGVITAGARLLPAAARFAPRALPAGHLPHRLR